MVISTDSTAATTIQKIPTKPETTTATSKTQVSSELPSATPSPTVITTISTTPNTKNTTPSYNVETATQPEDLVIADDCPPLSRIVNLDTLTQEEFISRLTDSCRFDRLIKPVTEAPLNVQFQIDMAHIESADHLVRKHCSKEFLKFYGNWCVYRAFQKGTAKEVFEF